ncbi:Hypothetical_protein [Hexamita inflata]|uniref:Hypothetical_protein n=1 Tax=Hexamita inflata TaxID=28002 RepID=A0AA86RDS9_9EUKA|nr:Hypothetical protein HINF_LOCUS58883 [Hexamita inflata]
MLEERLLQLTVLLITAREIILHKTTFSISIVQLNCASMILAYSLINIDYYQMCCHYEASQIFICLLQYMVLALDNSLSSISCCISCTVLNTIAISLNWYVQKQIKAFYPDSNSLIICKPDKQKGSYITFNKHIGKQTNKYNQ